MAVEADGRGTGAICDARRARESVCVVAAPPGPRPSLSITPPNQAADRVGQLLQRQVSRGGSLWDQNHTGGIAMARVQQTPFPRPRGVSG